MRLGFGRPRDVTNWKELTRKRRKCDKKIKRRKKAKILASVIWGLNLQVYFFADDLIVFGMFRDERQKNFIISCLALKCPSSESKQGDKLRKPAISMLEDGAAATKSTKLPTSI